MTPTLTKPLAYYAAHGAALFPIPAGSKVPTGIVASFARDCSMDTTQWDRWAAAHPGCNFGVVAFKSNWIIVDTDAQGDRAAAWAARLALFASWGVAPDAMPHVQSARGGWHDIFAVPEGVDATTLRQPDAEKGRINIRCRGYVVAAGSYYDGTPKQEASGAYVLLSDAPPHPAPAALIAHCSPSRRPASTKVGKWDIDDVSKLYTWMAERDGFTAYEDWVMAGMVAKVEFGDGAGLDLWQITHDGSVDGDTEHHKWESFADDASAGTVALGTVLDRAYKMGWKGNIRPSLQSTFGGVAALAALAGASLPGALPMLAGQQAIAALGKDMIDRFLDSVKDAPLRPAMSSPPTLPETMADHPLFTVIQDAILRILAMAENPRSFKGSRVIDALSIVSAVHQPTFDAVTERIAALGAALSLSQLSAKIKGFESRVKREVRTAAGFKVDQKGNPEKENSDNVDVFLKATGTEIRWNAWKLQSDTRQQPGDWEPLSDHSFGDLIVVANSGEYNYRPPDMLFKRTLNHLARQNVFDPVVDKIDALEKLWDKTPRLGIWLTAACGVPCDPYHQAVGKNIIGGMVRRARHAGCKHDETAILISPTQGTGKSDLCKMLAMETAWHTDSFKFDGSPQNNIPQLFGKWVVELSELAGMGKKDVESVKNILSAQSDFYTAKYESFAREHPRRCLFIGTSNDPNPLVDTSGNRRFLPVHVVGYVNLIWLRANIKQLIAEAATLDTNGVSFGIPEELWPVTTAYQEAARSESDVETLLRGWFGETPYTKDLAYVTAHDLAKLTHFAGWRGSQGRAACMRRLGFRSTQVYIVGDKTDVWVRGTFNTPRQVADNGVRYLIGMDSNHFPRVTISIPTPPQPR